MRPMKSGDDARHAAHPDGVDSHHAASRNSLPQETLNENETIIGISEESCPKPLKLFEVWSASMQKLNAEAAKFAQAEMKQRSGDEHSAATALQPTVCAEMVRTSVAVDMIDIARNLSRSSKHRAELQSLVTAQSENEEKTPWEALAVPTGKPLSIFDPSALPAAFTEFLFGDCVPFLKRQTPVTAQQIFDALPNREELQYSLEKMRKCTKPALDLVGTLLKSTLSFYPSYEL